MVMAETTQVQLETDVRDDLRARKVGNETYTDVVRRLLEEKDDES